jgi:hypothetical protein
MPDPLTPAQSRRLRRDGYLVLPGLVPADEAEGLRRAIANDPAFGAHLAARFASHGPLHEQLVDLLGEGVRPRDSAADWRPQVVAAPPGSTPLPRHLDGHRDGRYRPFDVIVGVLLTPVAEPADGGLWVWPAAFTPIVDHFREHGPALLLEGGHTPPVPLGEPVQVVAEAGSVVLIHPFLPHASTPPDAGRPARICLYWRLRRAGELDAAGLAAAPWGGWRLAGARRKEAV